MFIFYEKPIDNVKEPKCTPPFVNDDVELRDSLPTLKQSANDGVYDYVEAFPITLYPSSFCL